MAQMAVTDRAAVVSFGGHQFTEDLGTAVTSALTGHVSASDASDGRQSRPGARAADGWEYLAEGCAWVLDACD